MHHSVAIGDVCIELVERISAEVLKILLNLHRDIVTRQIVEQEVAIGPEPVRDGRKKDADRHGARRSLSPAILPHFPDAEHSGAPQSRVRDGSVQRSRA
jgi:hypothetical protein